jgi:tRNA pseudouridine38-40 synthase
LPNYALCVEYDGACFHGWQKQKSSKSVQGTLENALKTILRTNPHSHLTVAGRTDTGVHAMGMICNLKTEKPIPNLHKLIVSLNALSDDGVTIRRAMEVPDHFHARFSCTSREYIYQLYYSKYQSVLQENRSFWVKHRINWKKVEEEIPYLLGEKDFRSLTKARSMKGRRAVRRIHSLAIERDNLIPEIYRIRICANGFMHNMVRITVGTLLDIGKGRWESRSIESILEEADRTRAGVTLPPYGLYFVRAHYQDYPEIQSLYETLPP